MIPVSPDLSAGSIVTYRAHSSWGVGTVRRIDPDGLLMVAFDDVHPPYEGRFHERELETATKTTT